MKTKSAYNSKLLNLLVVVAVCACSIVVTLSMLAGTPKAVRKTSPTQKAGATNAAFTSPTKILTSQASGTATFSPMGFYPGYNASEVRATNADGSVAVGGSGPANPPGTEAGLVGVQWTAGGGLVTLPQIPYDGTPASPRFPGNFTVASDITPTGSWIAYRALPGWPNNLGRREAVICSGDFSQVITLGRLRPNGLSVANQI